MRSRPLSLAAVLLPLLPLLTTLACTGTAPYGDASVDDAAAPVDTANAGDAGNADVPLAPLPDAGFDLSIEAEFPPPPRALPLPPGSPKPQRLLSGPSDQLSGDAISSCSHQDPPSGAGDRWCSFYRPGADGVGTELWVINLTKAAAGIAVPCDGSSPHCVRLTKTLWTNFAFNGPTHPFSHKFDGDTLIYYADAVPPSKELYRGPVYAWRPDWPAPRQLTSGQGVWCFGHRSRALAHCLDNIVGDIKKPESFELRAGKLEPASTEPLPSLGRIRPLRADGRPAWQASFTPDGNHFVFSDLTPDPAVETLRIVATAELGQTAPRVLRDHVSHWAIANDNQRLYFLRATGQVQGQDEHDVFATDLLDMAAEVKLGARALNYRILGDGRNDLGIAFLSNLGGNQRAFQIAPDSKNPATLQTIFKYTGLLEGFDIAADHRFTVWLDGGFIGRVVRHADLGVCKLNTRANASIYVPTFLAKGNLVFFSQDGLEELGDRDGLYARSDDCSDVQRFGEKIDHYHPVGDRGLVYGDERTPAGAVMLKYASAVNEGGRWRLDTPRVIHDAVEAGVYYVLGGVPTYIHFRPHGPTAETWVYGPIAF
ncbi:MAG TPA: hypothetical protein VGF45_13025 [Polyangia bacterium]